MHDRCTYAKDEQAIQLAYFARHFSGRTGHRDRPFQLQHAHRLDALLPGIRGVADDIFQKLKIQWHTYIGHGRSSQACCINFLMPMADRPALLSRWIGAVLAIEPPEMIAVEPSVETHRFVAFEYTGPDGVDYMGETDGGTPQRGANATAADAAIAFVDHSGKRHLILIEWKYTEEYRSHRLSPDLQGKRQKRYANKSFAPEGPIRNDLGLTFADFLFEPFYQLLRQQILAQQIALRGQFDRVRVLHLSPLGNRVLHHVTAPALREVDGKAQTDCFAAFRACLHDPDAFIECSIERAFAPLASDPDANWWPQLAERYPSLCTTEIA